MPGSSNLIYAPGPFVYDFGDSNLFTFELDHDNTPYNYFFDNKPLTFLFDPFVSTIFLL